MGLRHTADCTVLPSRQELLRQLPHGGMVAEVGVDVGDFSADILEYNRPSKLILIDCWEGPRYGDGKAKVMMRFDHQISDGTVEIVQNHSIDALAKFPDRYFDWIYIDTDHKYETTAAELELCAQKVKEHGRIAGHDFCVGNIVRGRIYGVIQACERFCVDHNWYFEYITIESGGHFSYCLKKMSGIY
ncbi:hypothetical protein ATY76_22415 [Rhizobium sp. R339]|nr:hypothetical protein ATY76_22415 [Rhizobium sp. R339]